MLFNSLEYLVFILIVLILYWRSQRNVVRKIILLLASYYFYMSWFAPYGLLLLVVTLISYGGVKWMVGNLHHKKRILTLTLAFVLSFLLYYKYWGLLLGTVFQLFPNFWREPPETHIILPLAISFFTFHAISYVVDVYRGVQKPAHSIIDYAIYIAFFPQLIAGPIIRSTQFLYQLEKPKIFYWREFGLGLKLFVTGLLLKVIADDVAPFVDDFFSHPNTHFARSWTGVYGFALQIFCDFSGYTAMARGSALLFGFQISRNFKYPYLASSITEFWRRWHISLSTWLKSYLYIPLGGNRKGIVRTYINLIITMGLGGLWHGASWTFLIWGLYHGALLSLDKAAMHFGWFKPVLKKPWYVVLSTVITFHLVCIGWVIFRAENFQNLSYILTQSLTPSSYFKLTYEARHVLIMFGLFMAVSYAYISLIRYHRFRRWLYRPATVLVLFTLMFMMIFALYRSASEFIYFQF
jgi:alginate O-acetyltransferase complex protein AlgI